MVTGFHHGLLQSLSLLRFSRHILHQAGLSVDRALLRRVLYYSSASELSASRVGPLETYDGKPNYENC